MAANYKIGADVGSFKQGINEAQASLKTLDAALKVNEASFKAGGDAQTYMQQKTQLLNDKMTKQKSLVEQLQNGLKRMRENGVSPASVEYQRLETQMLNAQNAMLETNSAIQNLDESQQNATNSAEQLAASVGNIGKKVSLDAVIGGINNITGALEKAAGYAVQLGTKIWDDIMDTARLSDDYNTMAARYGVDTETLQKQLKIFDTMADTSIEAYYKARMKVANAIANPTDEQMTILESLGLVQRKKLMGQFGGPEQVQIMVDNAEEGLWEVGQRLRQKVESGELSRDNADVFAQALFGRGFQELNPLFQMGKDAFEEAVENQSAATKEAIENNAALNDSVILLEKNFETFKMEVLGKISPELTKVTDSLSDLMNSFTEYAQSDEGQALLKSLGEAVAALFEDLTNVDPDQALEGLVGVFEGIRDAFDWLKENKDSVIDAMRAIFDGWAALKLTGGVLQAWQLISGITGLKGVSTGAVGSAAGTGLTAVGNAAGIGTGTGLKGKVLNVLQTGIAGAGNMAAGITNAVAVGDYLVNNTRLGQEIRDTGDVIGAVQTVWNEKTQEVLKNASTFADDWKQVFDNVGGWFSGHAENGAKLQEAVIDYAAGLIDKWAEDHSASATKLFDPDQLQAEWDQLFGAAGAGGGGGSHGFDISVEPILANNAAEELQEQVSQITVQIGARIVPVTFGGGAGGGGGGKFGYLAQHANGIWSVPFDGYPAILHRGEQVVPAREVSSRSYNSNLYVEKMYMNNGTDAEGLANAMAAAQRRRMSGYGS